jgi:lipoic acid synthetase
MILRDKCTRSCSFCAVRHDIPLPLDEGEPQRVAMAVEALGLRYVVITSVTRDDQPDGGAFQFVKTIEMLHKNRRDIIVEVLIPDFRGSTDALRAVIEAKPQVINHNVETVPRLYPEVRPKAEYSCSIGLLFEVKCQDPKIITKSGLMVGLGETRNEVMEVMRDLREAKCNLLTIGQYLQPSPKHHPVTAFVSPQEFLDYERIGKDMGFTGVASGPFVRSSFRASELYALLTE